MRPVGDGHFRQLVAVVGFAEQRHRADDLAVERGHQDVTAALENVAVGVVEHLVVVRFDGEVALNPGAVEVAKGAGVRGRVGEKRDHAGRPA